MRIFFLAILLFTTTIGVAQTDSGSTDLSMITRRSDSMRRILDSMNKEFVNQANHESNDRMQEQSLNFFMEMQKERKAKEKRQATIRIIIGVVFLLVLVVGLRRRRAKQ